MSTAAERILVAVSDGTIDPETGVQLTNALIEVSEQEPQTRTVTRDDAETFVDLVLAHKGGRRVTVYSEGGFVANAYKWACYIQRLVYQPCYPHGKVTLDWTGAQRSGGVAPLEVVV